MDAEDFHSEPGRLSLVKYRAHRGGIELLRAYVERRKADSGRDEERRRELEKRLPAPGTAISHEEFREISTELLRMDILDELDQIIQDLVRFCEDPGHVDDQLPNLRSALRIGKGHAPSDSKLQERAWDIEQAWIGAYRKMPPYRSEHAIAKKIATIFGVSVSTALNHWKARLKRFQHEAKWVDEIKASCSKTVSKKKNKDPKKATKQRIKPKSWR